MQIIPVLDLMHGQVVRGVAGNRDVYKPVESILVDSSDALHVANAIRTKFGLDTFYVADLDAIVKRQPNLQTIANLADDGFSIMLDAGVRNAVDLQQMDVSKVASVVIALETIESAEAITDILTDLRSTRVVFSVDMKNGELLTKIPSWKSHGPEHIVQQLANQQLNEFILLDLAAVGVGQGVPTLPLCRSLKKTMPALSITTGGGVATIDDIIHAATSGVDGLLIASAIHDGRITANDLKRFSARQA